MTAAGPCPHCDPGFNLGPGELRIDGYPEDAEVEVTVTVSGADANRLLGYPVSVQTDV